MQLSTIRHKSIYILSVFFCCIANIFSYTADAQNMLQIPHTTGSAQFGNGTTVTIYRSGLPQTGVLANCAGASNPIGPNTIGGGNDSIYVYKFSHATDHVRFAFSASDQGEEVVFRINGQDYNLTSANVGLYSFSTCNCTNRGQASAAKLVFTGLSVSTLNCTQVDIYYPGIDSVQLYHNRTSASTFNAYFEPDTSVFIKQPFTDTALCQGALFPLVYNTNFRFNNNNVFTAQLSNASGSFASPVNIGTRADTTGDTIWCTIPKNTAVGNGYRIRIVSSNPSDTSLDNQEDIRIKAAPAAFSNSNNGAVCTDDTVKLIGSTTSTGVSWAWTGPNSFASAAKDTFIANSTMSHAGDYILTATLNSTGCSLTDTTTVVMKQRPAQPTAGSNSPVCATKPLQLTLASSTTGVNYSWVGPSGYSGTVANTTVTNNANSSHAGSYIGTATLNGCSSKDTTVVVVNPKPAKPTASSANAPICARQDLQLNATTVAGAGYNWYGSNGFTAATQNPIRTNADFADSGWYYVYADLLGCLSDTDSVKVVVNIDPYVNIYPSPGQTICTGTSATLTAVPTNGNGTAVYQWFLNNAATGITTVAYTNSSLVNGDEVYCLMTTTGTCATPFTDTSNKIPMTVNPLVAPEVTIKSDAGTTIYPNEPIVFNATPKNAGANPKYQWKRNGNDVVGATAGIFYANAHMFNDGDDLCVEITSDHACPDPKTALSNCIKLNIRLSVEDIDNNSKIKVYPNPTKGDIHFDIQSSNTGNVLVVLYDMTGKTVAREHLELGGKQTITVNRGQLMPGVYFYKVVTDSGSVQGKIELQ